MGRDTTGASSDVRLGASRVHGRGVFARRALRAGRVVARNPILVVGDPGPEIADYVFTWTDTEVALALGIISLVNHSDRPNAEVLSTEEQLQLVTLRPIAPGEEILVDYGPDHPVGQPR